MANERTFCYSGFTWHLLQRGTASSDNNNILGFSCFLSLNTLPTYNSKWYSTEKHTKQGWLKEKSADCFYMYKYFNDQKPERVPSLSRFIWEVQGLFPARAQQMACTRRNPARPKDEMANHPFQGSEPTIWSQKVYIFPS